jgi:hypothetical protein
MADASTLSEEVALLKRVLYKNHSQHRRSLYFHSLKSAYRSAKRIGDVDAEEQAALRAVRLLEGASAADDLRLAAAEVANILAQVSALGKSARLAHVRCYRAAKRLSGLVAQGFFLPFAVVCLACASRIASQVQEIQSRATVRARSACSRAGRHVARDGV